MPDGHVSLCESLRANADLTEKALDFMTDSEQVEESKADIALWRAAADEIERLRAAEAALLPLAWALEDDERHGNLTGRAENAWEAYKYGR